MKYDFGYAEEDRQGKPYESGLLRRLAPFMRPYGWLLAVSVVLVVAITSLDLALPYFTKIAIDRYVVPVDPAAATPDGKRRLAVDLEDPQVRAIVDRHRDLFAVNGQKATIAFDDMGMLDPDQLSMLRHDDIQGLGAMVVVFLLLVLANFILNFFQKIVMELAGHRVMHDLRMSLFDHLSHLSVSFFNRQPVARLTTRVTNDIQNMHELFTSFIALVFKDLFLLIGIAIVLFVMDWRLALATMAVLPFVVWASAGFAHRVRDVFRSLRIKVAEINTRFSETIQGIRVIQTFGWEKDNSRQFARLNQENFLLGMQQIHIFAIFMPMIEVLGIAAVAGIIYFGGGRVIGGQISLGVLVAFLSYVKMFFRPIRDLAEKYNILQNALASAERIFLLMDNAERLPEPSVPRDGAGAWQRFEKLELERVGFAYLADEPVLQNISLSIRRGETVALVGPSGAGKTTLLSLVLRFYDPTTGRIRLNGLDLRNGTQQQLRSTMALVPQDPFLFSGTVGDNIFGAGRPTDPDRVSQVLTAAHCADLVTRLPKGLDTVLNEGGGALSSGQRQLLAIARALARDPELILLDEATSYIDSDTEAKFTQALDNLMAGRTVILVAHRLSTARSADRIVVMRHGKVVETGDHEALMASRGLYYNLHLQQQRTRVAV